KADPPVLVSVPSFWYVLSLLPEPLFFRDTGIPPPSGAPPSSGFFFSHRTWKRRAVGRSTSADPSVYILDTVRALPPDSPHCRLRCPAVFRSTALPRCLSQAFRASYGSSLSCLRRWFPAVHRHRVPASQSSGDRERSCFHTFWTDSKR